MNNQLPESYIIQKFFQFAGYPKYKRTTNTYNGCCNICREDSSWGKKKRLFYIPQKNLISCHNCGKNWSPLNWIIQSSGLTYREVMKEAGQFDSSTFEFTEDTQKSKIITTVLPDDSINLFDAQQVEYYKDNTVVQDAIKFIQKRRLNVLINRPKALFISLKDYVHKNRLCLPFYNENGEIEFYQTRAIYKKDEVDRPKYLSKMNSEKTIFGMHNISVDLDHLFIFEGPIDSMCVPNGIAMGGVSLTDLQREQMQKYLLYNKIWILDNQLDNKEVKREMEGLIEQGENVFIWPEKFKEFKDVNEICEKCKINHITPKFFIKNAYNGVEATLRLQG